MTERGDMPYLVMQERLSREMAAEPGDPAVKRAHLKTADGYASKIRALGSR